MQWHPTRNMDNQKIRETSPRRQVLCLEIAVLLSKYHIILSRDQSLK